ncbi:S8 family peptidase [Hymenobacter sp. BT491]|uniref:S8 family peptidase n=1 Tax=Hymenobacter sp. BT491 TaxID=2766779 RepID=UPI001653A024|nr:S8 family peptidase [Hymenobacter sp. BT491]MBC6988643.1 S8 family serine peptidase [Hymenobacter sp. BT491]
MKPLLRLGLVLVSLVLFHFRPLMAQTRPVAPGTSLQLGTLVFKLRPELREAASPDAVAVPALQKALQQLRATTLQQKFPRSLAPDPEKPGAVDLRLVYQIRFSPDVAPEKACRSLLQTGAVEYAEPLYTRDPLTQPNDPLADSTRADGQYYLKNIQAYRAWDVTKGDTSIVIGITDTGTRYTHEDLKDQYKRNYADPIDGLDNDRDGYVDNFRGWDLADNDNDAFRQLGNAHGVQVTGCAVGRADNGVGLAGVGYACKFLPLKIYPTNSTGYFAGYEAIVYAADHGCQVINMSWGGAEGKSRFEQDVINYAAINRDAVLVAAAGNTKGDFDYYPASYDHVLSVAQLTATDAITDYTTYSYHVALSAPGLNILSTNGYNDADYALLFGGSSFSAPMVAGAAGLVRARFPQYNSQQVAAQLRQSADDIYAIAANTAYRDKLGKGRLNVHRAVALTDLRAVQITASTFAPSRLVQPPGDSLRLGIEIQNLLQPVDNLTITLTSLSPYLTVPQGTYSAGSLPTLGRATNASKPFRLTVAGPVPLNTKATLRYHITAANGFQDDQYVSVTLNPGYAVLDANELLLTLTSRGNVGYDGLGATWGESVAYQKSGALLYEGGLLVATSPTRVSDRLRNDRKSSDEDFYQLGQLTVQQPGARADQEAFGVFQDSLPALTKQRTVGVKIRQHAYAWSAAPNRDYVIVEYKLRNVTADTLRPLYAGLYMDWDMLPEPNRNAAAWDSVRAMGYAYDKGSPNFYAGVKLLQGGPATCYSLDNRAPAGSPVYLADGFSAAEKFATLSNGTRQRTVDPTNGTDVSQVVGTTLRALAPGDSATVGFAVLGANTLAQLQAAATAAQAKYNAVLPTRTATLAASWQVFPNPTTGQLRVELPSGFVGSNLLLLNSLGQVVQTDKIRASSATLDLRRYPAGVYVLQIRGPQTVLSRRIILNHK